MKRLHYFGSRQSFVETLKEEFYSLVESNQLEIHNGSIEDLNDFTFNEDTSASTIILDISPLDDLLAPKVCPSLLMLQEENQLTHTKIILAARKHPTIEQLGLYHSCGVHSYYIWGGDEKLFFRTILELLDQDPPDITEFATLNKIDSTIPCWFPASFRNISSKMSNIESSIALPLMEKTEIDGGLINDLGLRKISLSQEKNTDKPYYYPYQYAFHTPIISHNQGLTQNDLYGEKVSKSHFEEVINTHGKNFIQKMNTIWAFGPDRKIKRISKLLDIESCSVVHWFKTFNEVKDVTHLELPDLIFLNIDDPIADQKHENEKEGFKFEEIPQLIGLIKRQTNFSPIIIILNSPSHSLALQQVFQYEKLMAFQQKMTREVLIGIIDKYNHSFTTPLTYSSSQFVKVDSPDRIFWIKKELTLDRLNEDSIEFFYEGEIPPMTWIHVKLPCELSLVVTKSLPQKPAPEKMTAYKARIMGLQGLQESFLRIFINLCYDDPHEAFSQIDRYIKRAQLSLETVEGNKDENYNKAKSN
ncbi:MAG: hypothetical protein CME60_14410 [Halobacteriovoraceae bacterium]|nr:hypothetical protein [Halobacteriovoraceae bacterium]